MIRRVVTVVFSLALAHLPVSGHALELGDNPLALESEGGLQVTIAPTEDGSQALVKMTGVDHAIDGVVMLAEVEKRENEERAYQARVNGKIRSLVMYAKSHWASGDYTAYIPGQAEPHALTKNEEQSSSMDLAALQTEYEQQEERGTQEKVARFDREKAVKRQQQALSAIDRSASEVCGNPVSTRVDWEALDDNQLNNLSISGYCGQVAAEMEHLCRRDDSFREKMPVISEVDCNFGDALDLSQNGGKVAFQTQQDTRNQRDTITDFLREL